MLPRMLVKVKKAVRRLAPPPESLAPSGPENEASWQAMLGRVARADREAERRMAAAERALNKLGRS